jgi:BMFP domain-containing protein YqiC
MKAPEDFLDGLTEQLNQFVAQGKQSGEDIRHNIRSLVQSQLSKLDVVNREDFDVQQAILEKTRVQLIQLESKLADLEKRLDENSAAD